MLTLQDLTHLNAALNALSVAFLLAGYLFIQRGERQRHRACMLAALVVSAAFLVSYVIYKANSGFAKFGGEGAVVWVYFTILIVHVAGAAALLPLVPMTVIRALRERFDQHRRLARITWPLWVAVGVTGVVVYVMAVHVYPYTGT